jgi:two-component system chemotaxis response regulator CheB
MLSKYLEQSPDIQVVGTATNGKSAIMLNQKLKPNVITMDVKMPGLDGFSTIQEIMATHPVPILMVTASPVQEGVDLTFRALSVGALDLVQKPEASGESVQLLIDKIRLLAGVKVVHHIRHPATVPNPRPSPPPLAKRNLVAIAASTGGPKAILDILVTIPRDFPRCILITQHMPRGFTQGFAKWLGDSSALEVQELTNQSLIRPGRVLIAPADRHLVLRSAELIGLSDDPPLGSHRPSATVMFRSIANTCGPKAIGIVLTGMGQDGAQGLLEMRRSGAICIAQDNRSSLIFGMPKAAIELHAVDHILDLQGISNFLLQEAD